ncbi:MAG: biopolymer transporter ExbD [Pseudomonadota bacterium]
MRGRNIKSSNEANVDLTPMLDIVFILLIFFIVTSTFIQEDAIALEPPPPSCAKCPKPETQSILIYVDAANTVRIGGDLYDIGNVRSGVERRRAEMPTAAVIIQAHPEARTGTIILVRDAVYDAKVERVNIVRST